MASHLRAFHPDAWLQTLFRRRRNKRSKVNYREPKKQTVPTSGRHVWQAGGASGGNSLQIATGEGRRIENPWDDSPWLADVSDRLDGRVRMSGCIASVSDGLKPVSNRVARGLPRKWAIRGSLELGRSEEELTA